MVSPAFIFALLLLPAAAAIAVDSVSHGEGTGASHLDSEKAKHKPELHAKAQHKSNVHSKAEHTTALHDKVHHQPELHGKSEHNAALHDKAHHKPELHAKSEHKAALNDKAHHKIETHGKADHTSALHDKAHHQPELLGKSEHNAALHGKAHHKIELHGKAEHKAALHGKEHHKIELHGKAEHKSALQDKAHHKPELHGKSEHKAALHGKEHHKIELHGKADRKSALQDKAHHKPELHGKSKTKTEHKSAAHGKEHLHGKSSLHEKVHHKQKKAEANEGETLCEDVVNGSKCFTAVTWLRRDGFKLHPEWYPAYGAHSTFQEVQAMLFSLNKSHCPRPCSASPPISLNEADAGRVIEIDGSGRQVYSEGHALVQSAGCRDAQEGEYCFSSILWLAAKGMQKHPEWYPHLSPTSTVKEVQEELFRDNKSDCTRPCLAESGAARRFRLSHKALRDKDFASDACEDVAPGTKCHAAVTSALKEGVKEHPGQYPGLPPRADFRDMQENMHLRGAHHCPRPCPLRNPEQPENATGTGGPRVEDMTLEELVAHVGRASSKTTKTQENAAEDQVEDGVEAGKPKAGSTVHYNVQAEEEDDASRGPVLSPAPAREPEAPPALALNAEPAPAAAPLEPMGPPRTAPVLPQNPANSVDDEALPRLDRNAVEIL